ncbi:MAG: Ig-like domain-containing protein [Candidatus Limnocylindrales bacterium]
MAEPRVTRRIDRTTGRGGKADGSSGRGTTRIRGSGVRRSGSVQPGDDPDARMRVGWPRRAGVIIAMVALGGTIVFAGSGVLNGPNASGSPDGSHPLTGSSSPTIAPTPGQTAGAPTIDGETAIVTRTASWELSVTLPLTLPERRDSTIRIYRGGKLVAESDVRRTDPVTVADIPLRRGDNHLTAAIAGPAGVGPASLEVIVTRDDEAPRLQITQPSADRTVNAPSVMVAVEAEVGASITVRNETTDATHEGTAGDDGRFQIVVDLRPGENRLTVRAADAAGNTKTVDRIVIRGDASALATMTPTPATFKVSGLPSSITIEVFVLDADGVAADDAPVVFSLAPPGLPTSTYRTTTRYGVARWSNVPLSREGAFTGTGLATAEVTLPGGTVVHASTTFTFE